MLGFLVLLFPFVILAFVLIMERVEIPLTKVAPEREIERFLDDANPEELSAFVREGTDSGLSRFRNRLNVRRWRNRKAEPPASD